MENLKTRYTAASLLAQFVGRTFRDMITELAVIRNFSIDADELEALVLLEKNSVMAALDRNLKPTVGANNALAYTDGMGYTMAVVTSSAKDRVQLCLAKADQSRYFDDDRVFSAATSLAKPKGKPAPDIYVHGIDRLHKRPEECLAVEDSPSGVRSALAAKVAYVIGYVGCYEAHEVEEKAQLLRDNGATIIMYDWSEFPSIVENLSGITTILFDYDNTLGLTEVVAFAACCEVVNATLEKKGVVEVEQHA